MGIFGMFGKKEDPADAKDLFSRSQEAHLAKNLAAATDYARKAAQSGGEKETSWYKTLLLENFTRANSEGNKAEMLRLAEEAERHGDGTLLKHLAALTIPETMEDVERNLRYCDRAEALGEDVSGEREIAMLQKQDLELDAHFASMPMPEDITKTIQQAQQIVMEMAKAEQQNPD